MSHTYLWLQSHRTSAVSRSPDQYIFDPCTWSPSGVPRMRQYCCFLIFLSVLVLDQLSESSKPLKEMGHPYVPSNFHLCVMPLFSIKRIGPLGTEIPVSPKLQASFTSLKAMCNVKHLSAKRGTPLVRWFPWGLKSRSLGNYLSCSLTLHITLLPNIILP